MIPRMPNDTVPAVVVLTAQQAAAVKRAADESCRTPGGQLTYIVADWLGTHARTAGGLPNDPQPRPQPAA
jgi:hypothetical protein